MNDQGFFPITPPDPLQTAWLDTSDWGNAKRLVKIAMGQLKWVVEPECWAWYDGRRWSVERGDMEAQRFAHGVIEHIDGEAIALNAIAGDAKKLLDKLGWECSEEMAQERVKALRVHAVRSGSAGMTSGMLKQARSFLAVSTDDFDTDPLAYNVLNGTLRFRQDAKGKWGVKFTPHAPEDMLMQVADVEYDPKAVCPFWNERLAMLTPDPDQLAAFRLLYGYTLTGLTSDQAFYVHQGKGGDGKSVTHMALADIHGDYYQHAGVKTFLQGRDGGGQEHRSDLVRLAGDVRFVTCDEPKARSVWDGETVKQITGSKVTARGVREKTEITFEPRFKLHVECNNIPRAPSDDRGFRRRFKLYQWLVSIQDTPEGEMPIDQVRGKLHAEKPGILNWLIEGCLEWLETRKIPQPEAMAAVLDDFWASSSPISEWIVARCDTGDPTAKGYVKGLFADFKEWAEQQGVEHNFNSTSFGRELTNKQFRPDKDGKGIRFRWGIKLLPGGMYAGGAAAKEDGRSPQATRAPEPSDDDLYDDDIDPFRPGDDE